MASVAGCPEDTVTQQMDEAVAEIKQTVEDIEHRLATVSEKMTLCKMVLDDLKDLSHVLVRKSLQDVSLPPQQ